MAQPNPPTAESQFANTAEAYAQSKGHANPQELAWLVELVGPSPTDVLLDVATGPGHVALAFAPKVARVVALDPTSTMLDYVRAEAARRGLENVTTVEGRAETTGLDDNSFDLLTTRLGAHHFLNIVGAIQEFHRVLRPGGRILVYDTTVPEDDSLDEQINHIEIRRDPSHIRNYRASEWRAMLEAAGFELTYEDVAWFGNGHEMDVESWMDRIRTPAENRPLVRAAFRDASPALQTALRIVDGERFQLPRVVIVARK
jgi:ubiquinone/menaquinone biosynthesis C-methylase UbiE